MGYTGTGSLFTFAVDGHSTVCALADVQETACDDVIGRAAVYKEEVIVVEAGVGEALAVVDLLVQADDGGHVVFPEVRKVGLRGVQRVTCRGRYNTRGRVEYVFTLHISCRSDRHSLKVGHLTAAHM